MATSAAVLVDHLTASLSSPTEHRNKFLRVLSTYSKSQDEAARTQLLMQHFSLDDIVHTPSHPDEYDGAALLLELIEGALSFALDKGFTFIEVHTLLLLYLRSLELVCNTAHTGQLQSSVAEELKKIVLSYSGQLCQTKLLISAQYIADSILQHIKLYHFLLTEQRPLDSTQLKLDVYVPDSPTPLCEGQTKEDWEKKETFRLLEAEQSEKERELVKTSELAQEEADVKLCQAYQNELSKMSGDGRNMTEKDISEVIDSLARAHVEKIKVNTTQSLEKHSLDVEFKINRVEVLSSKGGQSSGPPNIPGDAPQKGSKSPQVK